jgi:ubiquinone/menaquinone biosynthesis C-methylase UbiE
MNSPPTQDLASTRQFWDANPCGVHDSFEMQKGQRYAMEPWLPAVLARIAAKHRTILEVGCGQGVDAIQLCSALPKDSSYNGIDYSPNSVATAQANAKFKVPELIVTPIFNVGNAESLDFGDSQFDAAYSMGVIHHTANPQKAIEEVHRVLSPGGTAYICLYRKPSLKVGAAKALRAFQHGLDALFGTERCIHAWLRKGGSHSKLFGTMFLECFGVPYMGWYSRAEIRQMFDIFSSVDLKTYGPNLGRLALGGKGETPFGYFWVIEATK